jgi:plasmid stabilization system protein ParE
LSYRIRFTREAESDLVRFYGFLLVEDNDAAARALEAITQGLEFLKRFPFSCRKATDENPLLRELLISFGNAGYVALFEIEDQETITILALRHQREDDYY